MGIGGTLKNCNNFRNGLYLGAAVLLRMLVFEGFRESLSSNTSGSERVSHLLFVMGSANRGDHPRE